MIIRQFVTIILLLISLSHQVYADTQCELGDKWSPITHDIAWSDYVDNPQLMNRVQLLNVWAVWCAPCRKELPILAKLDALPNIDVHLLNMGDEPAQAQEVLDSLEVTSVSTSRSDDHQLLKQFGVAGIPLTVMFIDGVAQYRYLGIVSNDAQIESFAQCLLDK